MKSWQLYIYLAALGILLTSAVNSLYYTESLIRVTFSEQLGFERVNHLVDFSEKWLWVGYVVIPVVVLLRTFYTALCLFCGLYFFNLTVGFDRIFKIALLADLIFVLSGLAKLVLLIFFKEVTTLHDLQFQPFSVIEFFPEISFDSMFVYPLSLLNLFELAYFIVLAWLIRDLLRKESSTGTIGFGKAFRLTGISYGSGLLLWILAVLFINLNLS
jgi:hypothetical protein